MSEGAMYWGDAKLGRLEKSRVDGGVIYSLSSVTSLFHDSLILILTYLITDLTTEGAMYWGDAKLGRLEKSRVDGSARRVIYSNVGDRYFGIALSAQYLYVTDWTERSVTWPAYHSQFSPIIWAFIVVFTVIQSYELLWII